MSLKSGLPRITWSFWAEVMPAPNLVQTVNSFRILTVLSVVLAVFFSSFSEQSKLVFSFASQDTLLKRDNLWVRRHHDRVRVQGLLWLVTSGRSCEWSGSIVDHSILPQIVFSSTYHSTWMREIWTCRLKCRKELLYSGNIQKFLPRLLMTAGDEAIVTSESCVAFRTWSKLNSRKFAWI